MFIKKRHYLVLGCNLGPCEDDQNSPLHYHHDGKKQQRQIKSQVHPCVNIYGIDFPEVQLRISLLIRALNYLAGAMTKNDARWLVVTRHFVQS